MITLTGRCTGCRHAINRGIDCFDCTVELKRFGGGHRLTVPRHDVGRGVSRPRRTPLKILTLCRGSGHNFHGGADPLNLRQRTDPVIPEPPGPNGRHRARLETARADRGVWHRLSNRPAA